MYAVPPPGRFAGNSRSSRCGPDQPIWAVYLASVACIQCSRYPWKWPECLSLDTCLDSRRDLAELRRIQTPAYERERRQAAAYPELPRVMDARLHQQALAAALDAQQDQALAAPAPIGLFVTGRETRLAACPFLQVGDPPGKIHQIEFPAAQHTFLEQAARLRPVQQLARARGLAVVRPELDVRREGKRRGPA